VLLRRTTRQANRCNETYQFSQLIHSSTISITFNVLRLVSIQNNQKTCFKKEQSLFIFNHEPVTPRNLCSTLQNTLSRHSKPLRSDILAAVKDHRENIGKISSIISLKKIIALKETGQFLNFGHLGYLFFASP
jgi:hypothetical protein